MDSKNGRPNQKINLPLLVIGLGAVLVIAVIFLFANRGGTPAISVDPQKIDYGYVQFGSDESFKIKVTNTGSGSLRFQKDPFIEVLEGC